MAELKDYDITIPQGTTYYLVAEWKQKDGTPNDASNLKARMMIRRRKDSTSAIASFSTDPDQGITMGGADGRVIVKIPAGQSSGFNFRSAVYDLEIHDDGDNFVKRLLQGAVILDKETTR